MEPKKVRITVVKKSFHEDFVKEYADPGAFQPKGCCHDYEIGQEFYSYGHIPEGFSD